MTHWLVDRVGDWFSSRTEQEQTILRWGTPLILALLLYLLLVLPVASAWHERQQLLQARLDDLHWLRAQTGLVEQTRGTCAARQQPLQLDRIESEISALGQRLSLTPQLRPVSGEDRWLVVLDPVQGNRLLVYARSLVCAGFRVSVLQFDRGPQAGDVGRGELQLELPLR